MEQLAAAAQRPAQPSAHNTNMEIDLAPPPFSLSTVKQTTARCRGEAGAEEKLRDSVKQTERDF